MDVTSQIDYEKLVERSLQEILRHEDFPRFLSWMNNEVGFTPQQSLFSPATDHLRPLATSLALAIWNGTPLPGNNFRPSPVPVPKRNQPCVCGSGKKYKQCCLMGEQGIPEIDENMVWPVLMEALPQKVVQKGLRDGTLPLGARVLHCAEMLDRGNSKKVVQLLKDYYFAETHTNRGEHAAFGLTLLLDAYDRQGLRDRKLDLVYHICSSVPSSPLRSEALQRLSTIQADSGDLPAAFETLKKARKDTPDNQDIGLLEVQLLLVQGDFLLARQRARFIVKQIHRRDAMFVDELYDNPMLDFLENVIEDPEMAASVMGGMSVSDDAALVQCLAEQDQRPVLHYLFDEDSGLAGVQGDDPAADRPHCIARTPAVLQKLEDAWYDVCPIEPLFGVTMVPFGDTDPWNEADSAQWKAFLLEHPAAFDSLMVVDDLLSMAALHPAWGQDAMMSALFEPLLSRGMKIVMESLQKLPENGCLPWLATENRPFLRTLLRGMIHARFSEKYVQAGEITLRLLELNPADNHGLREEVINQYLHAGNDLAALAIAENYPDDSLPGILYGHVLALYRLNRKKEALIAARKAKQLCPKVASWLIAPQKKDPQEYSEFGIVAGGRQEAWEYRAEMRTLWKKSRGLLSWLKKV